MISDAVKRRATVTLTSDTQLKVEREFDAPRQLVYRAFTTPDLIRRWWSAKRGTVTSADVDLRVGGRWRWVMRADGGFEVAFHGEYREIVPNERLVYTETYEGVPDAVALVKATFTESDERTTLTLLIDHQSRANRDGALKSGMEAGMQDAFDLIDGVLRSLQEG